MKTIYFIAILIFGLLGGYVIARISPELFKKSPTGIPQLTGRITLLNEYADGTSRDVGISVPYDITGTYPGTSLILLSPDKSKVVYTVWENAHIVIYAAKVDGSGVKKIAEQKVPEGSGALDINSIRWSDDGSHITYAEDGSNCSKKSCVNPVDFSEVRTTYGVDMDTGDQSIISINTSETESNTPAQRTYTSTDCGFSFKYPSDWIVKSDSRTKVELESPENAKAQKDFQDNHILGEPGPEYDFSVGCLPTLKEFMSQYGYGDLKANSLTDLLVAADDHMHDTHKIGETAVDGQVAQEVLHGGEGVIYQLWIDHGNIYVLSFPEVASKEKLTPQMRDILSSFVFAK